MWKILLIALSTWCSTTWAALSVEPQSLPSPLGDQAIMLSVTDEASRSVRVSAMSPTDTSREWTEAQQTPATFTLPDLRRDTVYTVTVEAVSGSPESVSIDIRTTNILSNVTETLGRENLLAAEETLDTLEAEHRLPPGTPALVALSLEMAATQQKIDILTETMAQIVERESTSPRLVEVVGEIEGRIASEEAHLSAVESIVGSR